MLRAFVKVIGLIDRQNSLHRRPKQWWTCGVRWANPFCSLHQLDGLRNGSLR
jgi:hypothetical protein